MPKNVLLSEEFTACLKQDRRKWYTIFHNCANLFPSRPATFASESNEENSTNYSDKSYRNPCGRYNVSRIGINSYYN